MTIDGYVTRSSVPGVSGRDLSYMGQFAFSGDPYGLTSGYLLVEDNFNPEVGFLQRDNLRRYSGSARFSPRPASPAWIRRLSFVANADHLWTATSGDLETRQYGGDVGVELENSDQISLSVSDDFERLDRPFTIASGVVIQPGDYDFTSFRASYNLGEQRRASATIVLRVGEFWSGTNTSLGVTQGRVELTPQVSLEPSYSINWVRLPEGDFDTHVARLRVTYTITPRMYLSGLTQYSSSDDVFSTNFRFRWEWSAGSELFVVYSEDRDTGMFVFPHGIIVDEEDNVWIVDAGVAEGKGNQIFKFSPRGEVLLTLGEPGVRGATERLLNEPSDLAIAPNGDIYVADGHIARESNARIVRFDRNGRFISAWGMKGDGPGELDCPHSIALDSRAASSSGTARTTGSRSSLPTVGSWTSGTSSVARTVSGSWTTCCTSPTRSRVRSKGRTATTRATTAGSTLAA